MPPLRLIKPHESPAPAAGARAPTQPPGSPGASSSTPETVAIRFESLPTPLRAVVRDQLDGSMRIEAELSWLAVGTVVHAGPAGEGERTGQVSAFDVELTRGGSARLVILTAPPTGAFSPAPAESPALQQPKSHLWKLLLRLIVIGAAAAGGYFVGQLYSPAMVLEAPRPTVGFPAPLPAPPAPPEQPATAGQR